MSIYLSDRSFGYIMNNYVNLALFTGSYSYGYKVSANSQTFNVEIVKQTFNSGITLKNNTRIQAISIDNCL